MKFCMITTFFGAHSFGGDAAYVDRLCRALLRQGHEVDVFYNISAFEAVRGDHPLRQYDPPEGLVLHGMRTPGGIAGLLWSHQTGRMGTLKRELGGHLAATTYDVIHFHNISLMGGPDLLRLKDRSGSATRFMSAHEHWLICPLSLLWKKKREVCKQPACVTCTVSAQRPPQWWRYGGLRDRSLATLDALFVPSFHTREIHQQRGISQPITRLPYFLPDDMVRQAQEAPSRRSPSGRPYFIMAGRLVVEKGFQEVIPHMNRFPEADLLIAGTGPFTANLKAQAAPHPNVHFLGLQDFAGLLQLFKGARALIVPSLFYETFGYVVLEAFATGTPAIVHDRGALPELITQSHAGYTYATDDELVTAMRLLLENPDIATSLGAKGQHAAQEKWGEERHLKQYLGVIEECRGKGRQSREWHANNV